MVDGKVRKVNRLPKIPVETESTWAEIQRVARRGLTTPLKRMKDRVWQ